MLPLHITLARTSSNAPSWKRNQTGVVNALPSFR